jgi:hypothetical protein
MRGGRGAEFVALVVSVAQERDRRGARWGAFLGGTVGGVEERGVASTRGERGGRSEKVVLHRAKLGCFFFILLSLSLARSDSLVKQHRGHQLDGVRSESVVERSGGGGGLQRLGGEETHLGRLQRRRQIFLESDEPEFEGIRFEAFIFVSGGFSGCKREGDEPSRGVPDRVARESGRRRGKSNGGKARLSPPIEGGTRRHFIFSSTSLAVSSHRIAGAARGAAGRDALVAVATQAGTTREAAREAEVCMGRGMPRGYGARARALEKKAKKCE